MGFAGIRYVAFFAATMGVLGALFSSATALSSLNQRATGQLPSPLAVLFGAMAFTTICMLAGNTSSVLKTQADEIAELRRQLAEIQKKR